MLKRCTYEEGCTVWMSSLCSFLLPVLSVKEQFEEAQRDSSNSPHLRVELQELMWLLFGPPDCRICIGYTSRGTSHHHVTAWPNKNLYNKKTNKKEKPWIWEPFMFLLASLPIPGLQRNELGLFNTESLCMGTEECHLFLTSFDSQYSNNSIVMYHSCPPSLCLPGRASLN